MSTTCPALRGTVAGDRGATAVEYALLVMLIAGVLIAVVGFLGQDVRGLFASVDW